MKQIDFSTPTTESGFCSIFPDRDGLGRSRKWWVDTSDIVAEESFQQSPKNLPGPKIFPLKNPMPNFRTLKISRTHLKVISHVVLYLAVLYSQNNAAGIRKHYYKSSDYFENPKNHCLNQATIPPAPPSTRGTWAARERRRQSPLSCSLASSLGSLCLP